MPDCGILDAEQNRVYQVTLEDDLTLEGYPVEDQGMADARLLPDGI